MKPKEGAKGTTTGACSCCMGKARYSLWFAAFSVSFFNVSLRVPTCSLEP